MSSLSHPPCVRRCSRSSPLHVLLSIIHLFTFLAAPTQASPHAAISIHQDSWTEEQASYTQPSQSRFISTIALSFTKSFKDGEEQGNFSDYEQNEVSSTSENVYQVPESSSLPPPVPWITTDTVFNNSTVPGTTIETLYTPDFVEVDNTTNSVYIDSDFHLSNKTKTPDFVDVNNATNSVYMNSNFHPSNKTKKPDSIINSPSLNSNPSRIFIPCIHGITPEQTFSNFNEDKLAKSDKPILNTKRKSNDLIATQSPKLFSTSVYYDISDEYSSFNETGNNSQTYVLGILDQVPPLTGVEVTVLIIKALVMITIILVSILGNFLVIVSVVLHRRLHSNANYLLVSLATADLLVALCAMTFNASVELSGGRWLFGSIMCDLWNSFDVYFSTVSIFHLCCISIDRFYAIVRPLEYPLNINRKTLAIMLAHSWIAPTLISFVPIFFGWYTTTEHLTEMKEHPGSCKFEVNMTYALVSSTLSFWCPCAIMISMYYCIFLEARRHERALLSRVSSASGCSMRLSGASQQQQEAAANAIIARQQLLVALQAAPFTPPVVPQYQEIAMKNLSDVASTVSATTTCSGLPSGSSSSRSSSGGGGNNAVVVNANHVSWWRHGSRHGSSASWYGMNHRGSLINSSRRPPAILTKTPHPGRREHKAARTLGLIMGAFVLCWLPFFTWYVSVNLCGDSCRSPPTVVTTLFWIGYFNSTLNPFIYAYFRTDFREAFNHTLWRIGCCRPQQPAGDFV
ncbi:unnamed protein product [Meganyctiphanes norvegica]|uniref:G-protein coupled receptors family 1 profile domain-containing protein n=1 Tax=Meganyctiphanes norvegica TaxID=48144 RepID=A0AAV2S942_MEGNR